MVKAHSKMPNLYGSARVLKREPQPIQFYLILTVIFSETTGGLNG
jgi:hypothetical protein